MRKILFALRSSIFGKPAPRVAALRLTGVIGPDGKFKQGINMTSVEPLLKEAFNISGLAAVALVINSPGGSPVQSGLIVDRIRAMATEKNVPILAFAEDVAASGGYMLALAADEIYCHPVSIIGSIGVISAGFGFPHLLEKMGIERRVYTAGDRKAMLDSFAEEKESDVSRLKEIHKEVHSFFKDMVLERRGKRLQSESEHLFSGDVFTGAEAVKLGLVDDIGDLRAVIKEKFGPKATIKWIGDKKPRLSKLVGLSAGIKGATLPSEMISAVEEKSYWSRFGL
ncbi:S49 family peptidase [Temperatibacter marinus]|uniref:S49 family peptidase n=1 Tax=Temperatibacter marinus TaxID=1456591 RepID=A0AA52EI81_9PROT|nr:S49 family peptidase [Temperatibacter marinus]WND03265.1 S49 family peptidase [Temperatibacter marinus]